MKNPETQSKYLFKSLLNGYGQMFLQENTYSGFLIMLGVFIGSWEIGIGTLLGVIASTYVAILMKYEKSQIGSGLFGFNGVAIGAACFFFLKINLTTVTLALVASGLSSILVYEMMRRKLIPFSMPFVILTWIVLYSLKLFNSGYLNQIQSFESSSLNLLSATSLGFSQVIFQSSILSGLVFILAIVINSKKDVFLFFFSSSLGASVAFLLGMPLSIINLGLYSYNAMLVSIALNTKTIKGIIYVFGAIVVSVLITHLFISFKIKALTFPFVITSWLFLLIKQHFK